jgi:hypothetical protein
MRQTNALEVSQITIIGTALVRKLENNVLRMCTSSETKEGVSAVQHRCVCLGDLAWSEAKQSLEPIKSIIFRALLPFGTQGAAVGPHARWLCAERLRL